VTKIILSFIHSFIQHVGSLIVRYIQLVTMTSNICHQEAANTQRHAGTLCKLYFDGSRQELMCIVDHTALVMALVKQIDCCYQKCSSNTGGSKPEPEEQPDEASQHEADE